MQSIKKNTPEVAPDGTVRIRDSRVTSPIRFTQIADVHLYPPPADRDCINDAYRMISCNGSLRALETPYNALTAQLAGMLDEVKARGDDFVAWSGDILDTYDPETAGLVVKLCRERDLPCYFQMGNHDWDYGWTITTNRNNSFWVTGYARSLQVDYDPTQEENIKEHGNFVSKFDFPSPLGVQNFEALTDQFFLL